MPPEFPAYQGYREFTYPIVRARHRRAALFLILLVAQRRELLQQDAAAGRLSWQFLACSISGGGRCLVPSALRDFLPSGGNGHLVSKMSRLHWNCLAIHVTYSCVYIFATHHAQHENLDNVSPRISHMVNAA